MDKTKKQVRRWLNAATIAAFSSLALILTEYWIGSDTTIQMIAVGITSTFFIVAVIWWYWAIMQIAEFANHIFSLKNTITSLKDDLKEIRKDIK